ncbi:MAG TPA: hypothetical protein VNZ26_02350 [Vicinamibacterales bacterium]|jgi:hypothetical protein|nr:hypothetical protein [Vicinamibacterales bacterium]
MTETTLTPSRLWKRMTLDQRQRAARAFWEDPEATEDQIQAALLIAQQKKFRPKTVVGLDLDHKAKHLASLATLPDKIAARALVVYHLSEHRPMMGAFLDALGVPHEDGLIKDEAAKEESGSAESSSVESSGGAASVKPDPAKFGSAVAALTERFPADDVRLYLNTLVSQDPETWGALRELVAQP